MQATTMFVIAILLRVKVFLFTCLHLYSYDLEGYYCPGRYITIFLKNATPLCYTRFPNLCSFTRVLIYPTFFTKYLFFPI